MRVGFPGGPRLEWYDRNPIDQTVSYVGSNVAPHSLTVRASYTVPTGKKAFIGGAAVEVSRRTVATTIGDVLAYVSFAGETSLNIFHRDNTEGTVERGSLNINGVMLAGASLTLNTQDTSEGGAMNYWISTVIMEFDA